MQWLIWVLLLGGVEVSVAGKAPTLLYFDVALVAWLVFQAVWAKFWPDFSGWIFRLGAFVFLAGVLSALVNLEGAYRSLATLKIFAVGLIVYAIARRRPVSALVLSAWGAVVAGVLLIHYWEALSSFSLEPYQDLGLGQLDEVKAGVVTVMGQGAYIDSILLLLIPISIAQVAVHRGWMRVLFGVLSAVTLGGMFATLSRGAVASLGLSFIACIPLLRKLRITRKLLPAVVPIALVLVLLIVKGVIQQSIELITFRLNNPDEGRKELMLASVDAFLHNPVLGVGPGQIGTAITQRVQSPALISDSRAQFLSSHNIILDALGENGLIPGVALLAMVALVLRSAWKHASTDPNPLSIGLFAGVVAAILMTMVEGPYLGEQFQVVFWSVAALIERQSSVVVPSPALSQSVTATARMA